MPVRVGAACGVRHPIMPRLRPEPVFSQGAHGQQHMGVGLFQPVRSDLVVPAHVRHHAMRNEAVFEIVAHDPDPLLRIEFARNHDAKLPRGLRVLSLLSRLHGVPQPFPVDTPNPDRGVVGKQDFLVLHVAPATVVMHDALAFTAHSRCARWTMATRAANMVESAEMAEKLAHFSSTVSSQKLEKAPFIKQLCLYLTGLKIRRAFARGGSSPPVRTRFSLH